jgi:hypothetical protein
LCLLLLALVEWAVVAPLWLRRSAGAVLLVVPHPRPGVPDLQIFIAVPGLGLGVFLLLTLREALEGMLALWLAPRELAVRP